MSALDPTPADLAWAREWMTTTITEDRASHVEMYVLTGVRAMLDRAAEAGERDATDRSVRQARALIAVLAEFRDSESAR